MASQTVQGRTADGNLEDLAVDAAGQLTSVNAVRLDDTTTPGYTYIGKALVGTAPSAAQWQIARLDTTSGLIKAWADGDALYNNAWDNRAALTYS